MRFLCLFLAAALAWGQRPQTTPAAPQQQPATLEGQVVNSKTGEPIRRAQVTLRGFRQDGPSGSYSASSGNDGRFQFQGVPPGSYIVQTERTGFVQSQQPQPAGRSSMMTTTLTAGGKSDIRVEMLPQAVISGRVTDEEGEPVSGVLVQLMRASYLNGKRQFNVANTASTNDLGEFRIFGLARGRYYLSAMRRSTPMYAGRRSSVPDSEESYVPVYYPGSTEATGAVALDVSPGTELRSVDVRLSKAKAFHVRGRLTGAIPTGRGRGVSVNLTPREAMSALGRTFSSGQIDPDSGEFDIPGVTPGSYILTADAFSRQDRGHLGARLPVEVTHANVSDLNLTLSPGLDVAGSIKVEGEAPQPLGSNITVQMNPLDGMASGGDAVRVKEDLTFSGFSLMPGAYGLSLGGVTQEAYIKSVRLGEAEVRDRPLDFSAGTAGPLQITLSFAGAQVQGVVTNSDQPFEGAIVVLVPADPQRRNLGFLYRTATTDKDGHYILNGVAPGDYKLFAWDKIESGAYQSPEFLQIYENDGITVTVQENGRETKALRVLTGGM